MDFDVKKVVKDNSTSLTKRLIETNLRQQPCDIRQITQLEEIGDGNLNIVYRVVLNEEGLSIIVKYAPPFIKVLGPSFPLTQDRLEVEYSALYTYHQLFPGCVPVPLLFDKQQNSIIMEDLKGWSLLRSELMEGKVDIEAIKNLMVSVATVHNLSSKPACSSEEHARMCETFSNKDMVSVTEQYVFVKPFMEDDPTNKHDPLLNQEVQTMRADSKCCQRAEEMRKLFVECQECFCHGDLHTGSVMINGGQSKMFDIEFALMGPATFDFGMFLANLLFVLVRHHILNNASAVKSVKDAIRAAIQSYTRVYAINEEGKFITDTCGFIGCEMIRRVVGAAHVADLSGQPKGELLALVLGRAFLLVAKDTGTLHNLVDIIEGTLTNNEL